MKKFIAVTLAGVAALLVPRLSSADTRVYVGIGLPAAPVIVESSRYHHYGYGAPVYYREPVVYYTPVTRHYGGGRDYHDHHQHRHDRHCRHDERREHRGDDRRWRGHDEGRGHWRDDDHRRHRDRRH